MQFNVEYRRKRNKQSQCNWMQSTEEKETSRANAIQCRVQKKKRRCKGENVLYPLLFKRSQVILINGFFLRRHSSTGLGWAIHPLPCKIWIPSMVGLGIPSTSTSMKKLNSQQKYPWFCKYPSGFLAISPSSVPLCVPRWRYMKKIKILMWVGSGGPGEEYFTGKGRSGHSIQFPTKFEDMHPL